MADPSNVIAFPVRQPALETAATDQIKRGAVPPHVLTLWAAEAAHGAEFVREVLQRLTAAAINGDLVMVQALAQSSRIEAAGLEKVTARLHRAMEPDSARQEGR